MKNDCFYRYDTMQLTIARQFNIFTGRWEPVSSGPNNHPPPSNNPRPKRGARPPPRVVSGS